jgi:phage-related protein
MRNTLEALKPPALRPVVWLGSSKANLLDFPKEARKLAGDELQLMQYGGMPQNAKPLKGLGNGIFEIAIRYDTDAYRVVLAVKLSEKIYVLHAFQKKSKKGIKTPPADMELIRKRYAVGVLAAKEEGKNERRN